MTTAPDSAALATAPPKWADHALRSGRLDAGWAPILASLPRSRFLPDLIWPKDPETGQNIPVDKATAPAAWRRWADADVPIVTQWDDQPAGGPGVAATSSASQPALVVDMLAELDVRPGHRVLDAGTGTGWTTGLLGARTGSANVVGIEYDSAVADAARARLRAAGLGPLVVTGDGAVGWPDGAPYDRVQCTYAVRRIPPAWVEQTRPGGLIVAPWEPGLADHGAVVRLTVGEDGTASGPFIRSVQFMGSRPERLTRVEREDYVPSGDGWPDGTVQTISTLRPVDLWDTPYNAAWWTVGLLVPDAMHATSVRDDGTVLGWLFSVRCRSWSIAYFDDDPEAEVYQGGPRRLWDEVEAAHRWWIEQDRPGHEDFGLTTGANGEHVWLRNPGHPLPEMP
ncbi:methyltransferase domain-containing protein [Thermomonospora umbrina]|uniref:Protein-L-isoaspartate O-methyltransferase n=1 Tax=Thermomonospora umbrina TaxID=111806 RepID=A0A3D9T9C7_9ACTN|nr:methyltransferase domain-containing protein [Thermomonospora umbrina]REF00362.1 protein-L-isoaspartate O-methyltransferase [Thermomonospora umbrina]